MASKEINTSCHCGAVNCTYHGTPERLVSCNCSICRRYRSLWAHGADGLISVAAQPDATLTYVWGDEEIAFHTCKTCGCTTHWASLSDDSSLKGALNMALAEPRDIAEITVRHFDGADTWQFVD